jgi:hypothetical protein
MPARRISNRPLPERRRWPRLPVVVPMFVHSKIDGTSFLELATAVNISNGGALICSRRALPRSRSVRVEIPHGTVPDQSLLHTSVRVIRARVTRVTPAQGCFLLALQWTHLLTEEDQTKPSRTSSVVNGQAGGAKTRVKQQVSASEAYADVKL